MFLSWIPPSSDNGAMITGYEILIQIGGAGPFNVFIANTSSTAVTTAITGLSAGVEYSFEVAAINAVGIGRPSSSSAIVAAGGTCRMQRV